MVSQGSNVEAVVAATSVQRKSSRRRDLTLDNCDLDDMRINTFSSFASYLNIDSFFFFFFLQRRYCYGSSAKLSTISKIT